MTKAKQVFISHAKEDAPFAHRLANDLRRLGVQVWIAPESIRPGESWVDAIERGLGESSHTVIVLTPKALKSRWVKKETGVAIAQERKGRIQVIPLKVEPCAVPLLLSSYQMVSFRHDYNAGLRQLADILGVHFTPPEPVHPPLAEPVAVLEQEAMPFWQKVPLWGWGSIGGLILLAVILLAVVRGVLLIRHGEPTPAPVAVKATTPATTVAPTATLVPSTAYPTDTPYPTHTPVPTDTPVPPTPTPLPPTDTPTLMMVAEVTTPAAAAETIKIGFDIPLTGDIPKVGEGSKYAGEMMLEKVNGAGGLVVGNKRHMLEFIYEDNESKAESATAAALKLITTDKVLAIVGPQASKQAVPTGEIAETNKTPMISPWSTNPRTTADRPYVFRACFLDPFQGAMIAKFATDEFGATKGAVLYDIASDYPKGVAESFKSAFEEIHGEGSVVAFETFTTKDRDFTAQLTKIVASDADFLFTPQYSSEVPLIVKQAHELGWDKPILGSDSWGSGELMTLCGDDCKGSFFSTHYAAAGAKGATKEFIDAYNAKYGYVPNDVAGLTWDALGILLQAIQNTGGLTGDLEKDREAVKDELGKIKDYEGITGKMSFFTPDGDPVKCAVIVKINDAAEFEFYKSSCP